jgi:hypothetical protein
VDFIKKTKAHDGKMNIGYQLQNCGQQSAAINLTENVSLIAGDKRLVKAIAWTNL